ncbi:hypothetical protein JVT61DRAFT_8189 [Boletus reticuloceps]|uniref:F-box domain-containing protein n=1 Tax=Boletus reticuloceps TaxID=495285 RepID=A0A8I2YVM0_9AGAM|nr:hypothetical protein JVT61DRAFT_8189 [Boletus reticuloceps]
MPLTACIDSPAKVSMSLADLPHEIVVTILQIALDATVVPSDVLCVCRLFRDLGTDHLYTHLKFTSAHQLRQFGLSEGPSPPIGPRSLAVDLAGKAQRGVLRDLCDALMKCRQLASVAEGSETSHIRLKRVHLRMHSYASDLEAVDVLQQGLQAIRDITVTNISFATSSDPEGQYPPLLGEVPSLRSIYIGRATFLHAQAVAGMLCQGRMAHLGVIRLVDVYSESIWGPRLRRSDVEKAVAMLCGTKEQMAVIARVKRVVTCEKKTERIMGGDRVEGTHILE